MKVTDIFAALERVAPVVLSDEFCAKFKTYDNSGIIINSGNEVTGALFALDLTQKAVEEAKRWGYNLIITHHPAIYGGISRFNVVGDPQAKALAECMKLGVSVISMHLNFDAAPEGIDYFLMRGLGGKTAEVVAQIKGGGYGRVYEIDPVVLSVFAQNAAKEFNTSRILVYGDQNKKIRRAASFCGAGCDDYNINFSAENCADVFVSSDMKHHEIVALTGRGIAVMVLTHYASENYGFNKIYLKIKDGLKVPSAFFTDADLL